MEAERRASGMPKREVSSVKLKIGGFKKKDSMAQSAST